MLQMGNLIYATPAIQRELISKWHHECTVKDFRKWWDARVCRTHRDGVTVPASRFRVYGTVR